MSIEWRQLRRQQVVSKYFTNPDLPVPYRTCFHHQFIQLDQAIERFATLGKSSQYTVILFDEHHLAAHLRNEGHSFWCDRFYRWRDSPSSARTPCHQVSHLHHPSSTSRHRDSQSQVESHYHRGLQLVFARCFISVRGS